MRKLRIIVFLMGFAMFAVPQFVLAEEADEKTAEKWVVEETGKEEAKKKKEKVVKVEDIQVTASREGNAIVLTPSSNTINIENYKSSVVPLDIVDILKDQAIIDYRGYSDLTQENDNIYMRGFDTHKFVTALDGLSVEKAGGNFTDFSTIPFSQIESIEIMPGPHSALYSGRSIGGVINVKTKTPKKYETLKPDFNVLTSYRSYNTQTYRVNMDGGVDSFIYGFSYEKYHTDGYLKNNESDIESIFGRFGYILPSDGYITLSASYQEADRESPVINSPSGKYADYYDPEYPMTESGQSPQTSPNSIKRPYSFRLNFNQPTSAGEWTLSTYYSHEDQKYFYDQGEEVRKEKEWNSYGGKIQNEIKLFEDHLVTVGFDYQQLRYGWQKIDISSGGYIQDKWTVLPRLTLTGGLRYEYIDIWWGKPPTDGPFTKTNFNQVLPKSFITYELDDLSDLLRDTSVSVGVSRIWTPKSYCQPCSWGSGIELDPVHGVGYDLVLTRRLWKNINLKVDFSYYEMKDYVVSATDQDYINEKPWGVRLLNLEKVIQEGIELELNGHIFDPLSFYISYAYTDWRYHGPHTAPYGDAAEQLGDRAENRVNAGLRYNLFENTLLLLDYKYQDEQVAYECEEEPVGSDIWYCYENPMDSYHVFDLAVEQTLFKNLGMMKDAVLKFYVTNLFNEEYENSKGYPMTDTTYGVALSLKM